MSFESNMIKPKPEAKRSIQNFVSFGEKGAEKTFSSEGYKAWLKNATLELKREYSNIPKNNGSNAKEVEKFGLELIMRVLMDKKNLELSPLERDYYDEVGQYKQEMLNMVDLIKEKCIISEINGSDQEKRAINIPRAERVQQAQPVLEIAKPTFKEIENQESLIMDIVHDYELDVENILNVMRDRYDKEKEPRLKEMLKNELLSVQSGILAKIEKDIENIEDSEYMQIAGAKADLLAVKEKILKTVEDIDLEEADVIAI